LKIDLNSSIKTLVSESISGGILLDELLKEIRKQFILEVLLANDLNESKTARKLGIHRNTLAIHLDELGIDSSKMRRQKRPTKRKRRPIESIRNDALSRWFDIESAVRQNGIRSAAIQFQVSESRVSQLMGKLRAARQGWAQG
jgi:Fis family transcriptional regulator